MCVGGEKIWKRLRKLPATMISQSFCLQQAHTFIVFPCAQSIRKKNTRGKSRKQSTNSDSAPTRSGFHVGLCPQNCHMFPADPPSQPGLQRSKLSFVRRRGRCLQNSFIKKKTNSLALRTKRRGEAGKCRGARNTPWSADCLCSNRGPITQQLCGVWQVI